jgi:hypothetical protein
MIPLMCAHPSDGTKFPPAAIEDARAARAVAEIKDGIGEVTDAALRVPVKQ